MTDELGFGKFQNQVDIIYIWLFADPRILVLSVPARKAYLLRNWCWCKI